jgi:predicted amidohydrolase
MAVAFANYGGPTGGLPSGGGSAILSESGELLVQLPATGAGIAIATEDGTFWRATRLML